MAVKALHGRMDGQSQPLQQVPGVMGTSVSLRPLPLATPHLLRSPCGWGGLDFTPEGLSLGCRPSQVPAAAPADSRYPPGG